MVLAIIFFDFTPKVKATKPKRLHQTKKHLYSKGNQQQNEEAAYRMRENICKLYIWQGVNIKNTWRTHITQ